MTIKTVSVAYLIEDGDLYPRHDVDSAHVSALAEAIRAGNKLPPPRVEAPPKAKTKAIEAAKAAKAADGDDEPPPVQYRIVDGWHRVRAYKKVLGDAAPIEVDVRTYENETDVIKDAIRLNAAHGRKLDSQDRTKSYLMLKSRGVEAETIAVTLNVTAPTVERIAVRVAIVKDTTGHEETVAVKPILWPRSGESPRRITSRQYETHKSSQGLRPTQVVGQLVRELRDRVVDLSDPALCARLWELHREIEKQVPAPKQRPA